MHTKEIEISKIKKGDVRAFKVLFEAFFIPLRNYAMTFLPDEGVCSDIAQESLIKYWERRENFDIIEKVKSFLYVVTKNAVLDEIKHSNVVKNGRDKISEKGEKVIITEEDFSSAMVVCEIFRLLKIELEKLPRRTREVMKMQMEGLSSPAIAEKLGISVDTVKTLKKIANKKLNKTMAKHKDIWKTYYEDFWK